MQRAFCYWLSEWSIDWNRLPFVMQETAKLLRVYYKPNELCLHESNKSQPLSCLWNNNLVSVLTKLVNSDGFLMYALCDDLGAPVTDSFIVHLRPTRRCAYDLPPTSNDMPVVTAESGLCI